MSCGSKLKTEIRKKEHAGLMEACNYAQYAGETERERERAKTETLLQKGSNSMFCTSVCVQCTLLYKSFGGLTEVLSYFNALKERLH